MLVRQYALYSCLKTFARFLASLVHKLCLFIAFSSIRYQIVQSLGNQSFIKRNTKQEREQKVLVFDKLCIGPCRLLLCMMSQQRRQLLYTGLSLCGVQALHGFCSGRGGERWDGSGLLLSWVSPPILRVRVSLCNIFRHELCLSFTET